MSPARALFTLPLWLAPLAALSAQPVVRSGKEPMNDARPAAAPAKELPPRPGRPRDVQVPATRAFVLPNGLRATLIPYGSVPKATVSLVVDAGGVYEAPDQVWLSDLTGKLLEQGTRTRSAAELAEAAARMGGELRITVGADRATLSGEVLGDFADDLLRLMSDMARQPLFPAGELPRLKADLQRQLSVELAQSQPQARARFREALYGDHPYGRLYPRPEQLEALTLEQVRAFHAAHWSSARAQVFVAGVFDAAAVEAAVREAFGSWESGTPARPAAAVARAARALHVIDRPGAVQSTLFVGLPVIDPSHADWPALNVAHTLLSGYFSSRITANIREDKGYTYSPQGILSSRRRDAFWAEEADVDTPVTGAALKEILTEIERLRREPPTEAEIDAVKAYMIGIFVLRNSNRAALINQLEFVELNGLASDYLATYVGRIQAVTAQQVQEMARRHLDPARLTLVVVGDRKTIDPQLEPFR